MNLFTKTVTLAVMVASTLGAAGCSTNADTGNAIAPEETPATAPVEASTTTRDARFFHYYAPFAPPAPRFEIRGFAPSANHFWAPGYYRWTGRDHVWVAGSWVLGRPGYVYNAPVWVNRFHRSEFIPGHWVRR